MEAKGRRKQTNVRLSEQALRILEKSRLITGMDNSWIVDQALKAYWRNGPRPPYVLVEQYERELQAARAEAQERIMELENQLAERNNRWAVNRAGASKSEAPEAG